MLRAAPGVGLQAKQREVAGAAPEVADQHHLGCVELLAVVVGRRHRLVLEDDLAEARLRERGAQPLHRQQLVGVGVTGEAHRAAHDDALAQVTELRLRGRAQLVQDARHQVFERVELAEHLGLAEQRTRKERLERLHETPLAAALQVAPDGGRTGARARRPGLSGVVVRLEVQDRSERGGALAAARERVRGEPRRSGAIGHGNRAVGRSEVESHRSRAHCTPSGSATHDTPPGAVAGWGSTSERTKARPGAHRGGLDADCGRQDATKRPRVQPGATALALRAAAARGAPAPPAAPSRAPAPAAA